ncbi:hypothetical protein ACP70R_016353 [Stipagrostis hirtigluma subsp. patula]
MVVTEGTVIRTVSESKPGSEHKDSLTELPRAMDTLGVHNHEEEKLIGHEVDTALTPYEGMEFGSEDAAKDFYSAYARSAGFRIRISRYTRSRRDNSIISRRIVCSKEGFHETRACDGLHADQKQQGRAGTRVGCKAMIMIKKFAPGKWIVTKFIKNHNHGPVPPRKLDARLAHVDYDPMEKPHSVDEDPIDEPFEGMEFESEEAAKLFYVNYARLNGFRARISRSHQTMPNWEQGTHGSEGSYLHFENIKESSSQKSQNFRGKDERIRGSPEETMVAIPAIPLALCMPMTRNIPGASADGPYRLLAAPIQAVPISYRPAEPIRQEQRSSRDLRPFTGVLSEVNKQGKGPNPLVHATALACGARIVPFEEAGSLIKAIESKIRSGGAIIAKLPSSNLASLVPEAASMSSSSEDDEEHDNLMVDIKRNCHDQSSEEMKLQGEPSELETEAENFSLPSGNENNVSADC